MIKKEDEEILKIIKENNISAEELLNLKKNIKDNQNNNNSSLDTIVELLKDKVSKSSQIKEEDKDNDLDKYIKEKEEIEAKKQMEEDLIRKKIELYNDTKSLIMEHLPTSDLAKNWNKYKEAWGEDELYRVAMKTAFEKLSNNYIRAIFNNDFESMKPQDRYKFINALKNQIEVDVNSNTKRLLKSQGYKDKKNDFELTIDDINPQTEEADLILAFNNTRNELFNKKLKEILPN